MAALLPRRVARSASVGDRVVADRRSEARHAVTVRRDRDRRRRSRSATARASSSTGEVVTAEHTRGRVRVTRRPSRRRAASRAIVLAQALAKGDRDELAVQAATELGVDEVMPWQAARSISRWDGAKVAKGRARWAAIVREATQAGASRLAARRRSTSRRPSSWSPMAQERGCSCSSRRADVHARRLELDGRDATSCSSSARRAASRQQELDALAGGRGDPRPPRQRVLRTSTAGPAALAVLSVGSAAGSAPR